MSLVALSVTAPERDRHSRIVTSVGTGGYLSVYRPGCEHRTQGAKRRGTSVVSASTGGENMVESFTMATATPLERIRGGFRGATLAVHAWTGRSALSSATTTSRPHIATAGARRTRVSDVRLPAAGIVRPLRNGAATNSAVTLLKPRGTGASHALSG